MRTLFLSFVLLFSLSISYSQSIEELQRSVKKAEEEIKKGNELLKINKNRQASNVEKIIITRNNIRNREKIISDLTKQVDLINLDISKGNDNIDLLSKDLALQKSDYSKLMVTGYKNYISNKNLLFLFSSTSFYDLQLRIYYLRKYGEKKIEMAKSIEKKSSEIVEHVNALSKKRETLNKTLDSRKSEIDLLEKERAGYNALAAQLSSEDKKLNKQIEQGIQSKRSLEKKIAEIIAEENRKRAKAKVSDADKAKNIALNEDFVKNRGILPSPVDGGTVIEAFGTHKHPLHPNLVVNNNGIDIAIKSGSSVKAIFNGVVTKIFVLQGLNTSVLIRHGDYISAYSGLDIVSVKVGDVVKTGTVIGKINAAAQNNNAVLHFELWKGVTPQNPESWLR